VDVVVVVEDRVQRPGAERADDRAAAERDPWIDPGPRLGLRQDRDLGIVGRHVDDVGARRLDVDVLLAAHDLVLVRLQVAGIPDGAPIILDRVQHVALLIGDRLAHLIGPRRVVVEPAQHVRELEQADDAAVPVAILRDLFDALRLPDVQRGVVDLIGIGRRRQER
jgi:hypothetical protein